VYALQVAGITTAGGAELIDAALFAYCGSIGLTTAHRYQRRTN
jgi:hypothetical protein